MQGLTVTKGNAGLGGGILNRGTLTLVGVNVADNTGDLGGGIYNEGTLTLTAGSRVTGNVASIASGGGGSSTRARRTSRTTPS